MSDFRSRLEGSLGDRYVLDRELGTGGMATVFLATDTKHDRPVALKVLRSEVADTLAAERFLREIDAVARLTHPHILPLHDSGEAAGLLYYVMPYVEGESLRDRLRREGALPVEDALQIARECADALAYAHDQGVMHRDVKPANILLSGGHAVLADFGIARALEAAADRPTLTRTGVSIGTLGYMSPEQASGDESVDPRSDVYALGCVLYEMLAGEPAFRGPTAHAVMARQIEGPPSVTTVRSAVPASLERVLEKACRVTAADRYGSAAELSRALKEARAEVDVGGSSPQVVNRGLVAVGLVVAAAVGGWYLLDDRRGTGGEAMERSIAVLPFEALSPDEDSETFARGVHQDLLTRLHGVSGFTVISRTAVMQYEDSVLTAGRIAEILGVRWVMEGGVQKVGDQLQVNAQLIDPRTESPVWADSYRRDLTAENLFALQSDITKKIAASLEGELTPEERERVERQPTTDLDAYLLYVRGRSLLDSRTRGGIQQAVGYFRQAIQRDSSYALAWSGLSDALSLVEFYDYGPADTLGPSALDAAQRAVELGPSLGEAHASLGIARSLRREGPMALADLERAVELKPGYAEAFVWLGWVRLLLGDPEGAWEPAHRAVELNPLAPAYRVYLAEAHLANDRRSEALEEARQARRLQPDYGLAHFMEGLALHHLNRHAEADSAFSRSRPLVPTEGTPTYAEIDAALVAVRTALGDTVGARTLASETDLSSAPFSAGLIHAALGERDAAFAAFARVEDWGSFTTEHARYFFGAALGPLREDRRWEELMGRMNRHWGLNPDGSEPEEGGSPAGSESAQAGDHVFPAGDVRELPGPPLEVLPVELFALAPHHAYRILDIPGTTRKELVEDQGFGGRPSIARAMAKSLSRSVRRSPGKPGLRAAASAHSASNHARASAWVKWAKRRRA